ncbi:uncharacterized protein LOC134811662 [Bolinopsis microptera]|uniref:uncharacterized protein LOC134811662 n=1 Tax=Bolinopsis microptera TaxID=2820187 RepID=UPI003079976E
MTAKPKERSLEKTVTTSDPPTGDSSLPKSEKSIERRKSNLVRRLSKRIRRIVDDKILDDRHTDETLISNIPPKSPGKPVQKSTSLNRDKRNQVSMRRRLGSKNHTISKCHFELKDFENYSTEDIPQLAEHFVKCTDPAHILPSKKCESHIAFSSKPPFLKVKKEEIPDVAFAEENHTEDPEIQKIIDLLVQRANQYNDAAEGNNEEMRELVMGANSNMRWYLINRVWEGIKATSRSVDWTDFLKMMILS